ncbi:hypothetical protein [uncultured Bacteroides sp.]|uniref:hypothetical protein n=1 Tax=uncultured Bacteroides sp. TaxID=162156 RepID=UPI0025B65452|nr:hypothetical protein [uncultured Bacteroides sp.]
MAKVTDGEADPISMFTTIKAMNDCLSQFLKDQAVVEATIGAVEKYGRTGATFNGANLCIAEVGVRFDFSACQDSVWDELAKERTELEAKIKEREKFLRGITTPQTIVNEETGEVKKIYGPAKTSSTTVKVTFSK